MELLEDIAVSFLLFVSLAVTAVSLTAPLAVWSSVWCEVRAAALHSDNSDGLSDSGHNRQLAIHIVFAGLVATAMAAAIAYGIYRAATDANMLSDTEYCGIPIMLSWMLGPVLIAATGWVIWRGKLQDYGAAICGLSWIPIAYVVYGFTGATTYMEFWLHAWSYWHMASLAVAATVMLAVMWRVFGPCYDYK